MIRLLLNIVFYKQISYFLLDFFTNPELNISNLG